MPSLNKRLFLNWEFPLTAVWEFWREKPFHLKANASNLYEPPNYCFFDFYFMRAHLRFCCLVLGSRAKLFACEKVVSPARVTLPAEARQLVSQSCLALPGYSGRKGWFKEFVEIEAFLDELQWPLPRSDIVFLLGKMDYHAYRTFFTPTKVYMQCHSFANK